MRIVDSDDKDVTPDTVGELLFRGLGVVASYIGGAVSAESFASGAGYAPAIWPMPTRVDWYT